MRLLGDQKQIFILGSLLLHLVPAVLIGAEIQEFRFSAASLPREQILQVNLLPSVPSSIPSNKFSGPEKESSPQEVSSPSSPSFKRAPTSSASTVDEALLRQEKTVEEVDSPAGSPDLPLLYLSGGEMDERPWPDMPLLIPFPDVPWEGGHIEGVVEIFVEVDGTINHIQIKDSTLPPAFEHMVLDTFKQAKFKPGIKNGKPVRSIMKILVEFEGQ